MPFPPTTSCCSVTHNISKAPRRRTNRARHRPRRLGSVHLPGSSGHRFGRCAMDASNTFRPPCCIFFIAVLLPSGRILTVARPAIPLRKPSSRDSSNWSSGMPMRSGGTIDRSEPRSISASSTIPTFAICTPSSPMRDANYGCSTSPAISAFRPMWRYCIGCKTDRKISSLAPARISTSALRCCVP